MARYALIDGYLDTMRSRIQWRRDLDDLVAEMEDHLYSTAEGLCAIGVDDHDAQRVTLDRFGDPRILTAAYASTQQGGLAVPTTFTKRAGLMALIASAFWIVVAAADLFMAGDGDTWQVYYTVMSVAALVASVLGVIVMVAINKRLGGLGALGLVAIGLMCLGAVASIVAWAVFLWMTIQGLAWLVFGIAVLRSGIAPRTPTVLASGGFVVGSIVFIVANALEVGWQDSYGDYPVAWLAGLITGCTLMSIGLFGLGTWLRSEEPVEIESTPIAA